MDMEEMLRKAQEAAETIQKQMGEAQAKLDSVEVEGKLVNDVRGAVLEGSNLSLLGQSYLTRMGEVQMTGDYMLLK